MKQFYFVAQKVIQCCHLLWTSMCSSGILFILWGSGWLGWMHTHLLSWFISMKADFVGECIFFLPCLIQYSSLSVCHIKRDQKLFPEGMNEYHCHLSLSHSIRFECNLTMFGGQWIKRNLTCCFSCFYRLVNIKSFFKPPGPFSLYSVTT